MTNDNNNAVALLSSNTHGFIEVLNSYENDRSHGVEWRTVEPSVLLREITEDMTFKLININKYNYAELIALAESTYVIAVPDVGVVTLSYPDEQLTAA